MAETNFFVKIVKGGEDGFSLYPIFGNSRVLVNHSCKFELQLCLRGSCALDATYLEETHSIRRRHCTLDLNPQITFINISYKTRQLFLVAQANLGS